MRSHSHARLVVLLAVSNVACSEWRPPEAEAEAEAEPRIRLESCLLANPGTPRRLRAECGTLEVREDRAGRGGHNIELRVAVIEARSPEPRPDPLFFLAGGPGEAASESYLSFSPAFVFVEDRDIVLVDQRGTGGSHALRCPPSEQAFALERPIAAELRAEASDCLEALDADPTLYSTVAAIHDLDAVRVALGYEKINLFGISYGTRVALGYLRRFGSQVRSVVLDGVAPPDIPMGAEVGLHAQRALDRIRSRCQRDPACGFTETRAQLEALFARLQGAPASVHFPHPRTQVMVRGHLSPDTLARTIRLLLYQPETAALLPLLIDDAHRRGDLSLLAAQAVIIGDALETAIASGLNLAVVCSEDAPFFGPAPDLAGRGSVARYNRERDVIETICAAWPRSQVPPDFREPVSSDVPTLLLSGEIDPVTPPAYAKHAGASLSRARHVVVPGHGHGMAIRGCLARIIAQFLEDGSVTGLDLECAQKSAPLGIFLDFSGPSP